VRLEETGIEFVGGPPDKEGGAEDDGGEEALVDTPDTVRFILKYVKTVGPRSGYDFGVGIQGTRVDAIFRRILHL